MAFEEYALRYVDAVSALTTGSVYIYSIMPRAREDGSVHGLHDTILSMNAAIRAEIDSRHDPRLIYLDVYSSFLGEKGGLNMNYSYDGLHLNPYGYEILTKALNEKLL